MTPIGINHAAVLRLSEKRLGFAGLRVLNLQSFLLLLILSILPGAASALTVNLLQVDRPDIVIPIILAIEIPFAIWVSGFMSANDRRTIRATFTTIMSHDFSDMSADEVISTIFWGQNSIVFFIFRIWLAVCTAMICAITFGQIEPALMIRLDMPPMIIVLMSFSLFSYIFVRNICEETVRDQLGHACLTTVFCALLFAGFYYLI
jgi:hypothetical protein